MFRRHNGAQGAASSEAQEDRSAPAPSREKVRRGSAGAEDADSYKPKGGEGGSGRRGNFCGEKVRRGSGGGEDADSFKPKGGEGGSFRRGSFCGGLLKRRDSYSKNVNRPSEPSMREDQIHFTRCTVPSAISAISAPLKLLHRACYR